MSARVKPPPGRAFMASKPQFNRVMAERHQAVVAVGAWVESGQDFSEHPSTLALLTEELQEEMRRKKEERLRRFQDEVRHRVARRAKASKIRPLFPPHSAGSPDRSTQQHHIRSPQVTDEEKQMISEESRRVRLRLAACRVNQDEEAVPNLPGGKWKISPSRHQTSESPVQETEDDLPIPSQHECPLVHQKMGGYASPEFDEVCSEPEVGPSSEANFIVAQIFLSQSEKAKLRKQRQSQILMQRRMAMTTDRERVKEHREHRKHLEKTARIKAEKERIRLEQEKQLEEEQQLTEAKQKLKEREQLILERLKLEEEEEKAVQLQNKKKELRKKEGLRFIDALRAQLKERLCKLKHEPPPLCCCASSFWDTDPDTCANNCVFYNNPGAYSQALHSTLMCLESN